MVLEVETVWDAVRLLLRSCHRVCGLISQQCRKVGHLGVGREEEERESRWRPGWPALYLRLLRGSGPMALLAGLASVALALKWEGWARRLRVTWVH